jgi:hypothetical protein
MPSTQTAYARRLLDKFLGATQDRDGVESDEREFYNLTNLRNKNLEALGKRLGSAKVFSQTSATGAKVYGLHTFVDEAGTELYLKMAGDTLYKSSGAAWSAIGAVAFTQATTYFATLSTRDTGVSASDSGTSTSADSTTLSETGAGMTRNAHVGRVIVQNNETKLIAANNATKIFLGERWDDIPSSASYNVYPRAPEFFIANGTNFYKCDGTTLTQLDNSVFGYAFDGIDAHQGRLFGWKGTRLHWSDLGVGEHFSRSAWRDFPTTIIRVKSWGNVLVVYERKRVTVMFGDNPDNFFFKEVLVGTGTESPKSVANYGDYQVFVDMDLGVCILSNKKLSENGEEPLSIMEGYFLTDFKTQSAANIKAAAGAVFQDHYHLCIDDDWYLLNFKSSDLTPTLGFRKWIWTKSDYPDAIDANVLGQFGQKFVAGAQDNGQVYELETGNADDGTAIATVQEKRDWNPGNTSARKKFYALRTQQPITASVVTMSYFFDADGSTYGSADKTIALASASFPTHDVRIPGNPSDSKDVGVTLSYKITESSSNAVSDIQQMELLFFPAVL